MPLYTIGYEKRSLAEYLALLREHRIAVLVDVRETPWSHKPGFSKAPLAAALEADGIEYLHAAFAGNPKWLRDARQPGVTAGVPKGGSSVTHL
jgi:uncharacterized protein (DUF488 family)